MAISLPLKKLSFCAPWSTLTSGLLVECPRCLRDRTLRCDCKPNERRAVPCPRCASSPRPACRRCQGTGSCPCTHNAHYRIDCPLCMSWGSILSQKAKVFLIIGSFMVTVSVIWGVTRWLSPGQSTHNESPKEVPSAQMTAPLGNSPKSAPVEPGHGSKEFIW
jgi:hypothetical protein